MRGAFRESAHEAEGKEKRWPQALNKEARRWPGLLWTGTESNRRHMDFQSIALPSELPVRKLPNLSSPKSESKFEEVFRIPTSICRKPNFLSPCSEKELQDPTAFYRDPNPRCSEDPVEMPAKSLAGDGPYDHWSTTFSRFRLPVLQRTTELSENQYFRTTISALNRARRSSL